MLGPFPILVSVVVVVVVERLGDDTVNNSSYLKMSPRGKVADNLINFFIAASIVQVSM